MFSKNERVRETIVSSFGCEWHQAWGMYHVHFRALHHSECKVTRFYGCNHCKATFIYEHTFCSWIHVCICTAFVLIAWAVHWQPGWCNSNVTGETERECLHKGRPASNFTFVPQLLLCWILNCTPLQKILSLWIIFRLSDSCVLGQKCLKTINLSQQKSFQNSRENISVLIKHLDSRYIYHGTETCGLVGKKGQNCL